jgi:hypothetical protein
MSQDNKIIATAKTMLKIIKRRRMVRKEIRRNFMGEKEMGKMEGNYGRY